jgi:hypothetical protein
MVSDVAMSIRETDVTLAGIFLQSQSDQFLLDLNPQIAWNTA